MKPQPAKGAVAAGHHLTARAACTILRAGGNAFDAAIAAAWMACVCEPVLASPGGGGFALVSTKDGKVEVADFFAQTPRQRQKDANDFRQITADFGAATQDFHIGEAASATPGFIPGMLALNRHCASMAMTDLVQPAVAAARNGFAITPFQHFLFKVVAPILKDSAKARELFAPSGDVLAQGTRFCNHDLADFIEQAARTGNSDEMIAAISGQQQAKGHLTMDDFTAYKVEWRRPLRLPLGQSTAFLNPPPSAGGALIAAAFGALRGDSDFDIAQALGTVDRARRTKGQSIEALLTGLGPPSYRGTTHISTADNSGNACAMTLSNGEGNGNIVGRFGFMLNNMLGEEDINPCGADGWTENMRMSSMMCPAVLHTPAGGKMALGTGGSNRIRSTIFQVLCHLALKQMNARSAVGAPRVHVEDGHIDIEPGFDAAMIARLTAAFSSHRLWPEKNLFFGGCHIAGQSPDGRFFGAGDDRREGVFMLA